MVQQPQAADFSVAVSSSAVSISQRGVSALVSFSMISHNGFSANVYVAGKRFSIWNKDGHGRQACNGNIAGWEYTDRGLARSTGQPPAADAHECKRRDSADAVLSAN